MKPPRVTGVRRNFLVSSVHSAFHKESNIPFDIAEQICELRGQFESMRDVAGLSSRRCILAPSVIIAQLVATKAAVAAGQRLLA